MRLDGGGASQWRDGEGNGECENVIVIVRLE